METEHDLIINKSTLFGYRFAPMPEMIRRSPKLSAGAKILHNEIISYIWQRDEVASWPLQKTLAEMLNTTTQSIRSQLAELEAVALIKIEHQGARKGNKYYLLDPKPDLLGVELGENGRYRPKESDRNKTSALDVESNEVKDES